MPHSETGQVLNNANKRGVLLFNVGVQWGYELKNSRLGHIVGFTTLIGQLFWEGAVQNLAFFHRLVFVGLFLLCSTIIHVQFCE